jgi:hypothetical protein
VLAFYSSGVFSQCYGVLCDVRMFGSSLYELFVFFVRMNRKSFDAENIADITTVK